VSAVTGSVLVLGEPETIAAIALPQLLEQTSLRCHRLRIVAVIEPLSVLHACASLAGVDPLTVREHHRAQALYVARAAAQALAEAHATEHCVAAGWPSALSMARHGGFDSVLALPPRRLIDRLRLRRLRLPVAAATHPVTPAALGRAAAG
jgi:hypothetical protein